MRRVSWWVGTAAVGVAALWAVAALALFPGWPSVARAAAVAAFIVLAIGFGIRRSVYPAVRLGGVAALAFFVWLGLLLVRPTNQRTWMPDQERLPQARLVGDVATIANVRHAVYRSETDYDVRWETRSYDLQTIRSVDFGVEPFGDWRGLAHVFLAFGFEGGEHLAVSVEIRKEPGESYSPLRGLYRHYEIMYVLADERDVIGLRANVRRHPVHLYPIRASHEQVRGLFLSILARVQSLEREPEFYHSLRRTCSTSVLKHVNELREDRIVADWRILFPGHSDALALELGLVDFEGDIEAARARFLINERASFDPEVSGPGWSARIRNFGTLQQPSSVP